MRGRAPSADFDPAITQDIQRGYTLGDSDRVIVRKRQEHHRMADADLAGALRDRAVQHLGRRGVREADLEVMLDGPKVGEPHLLCTDHLIHHIVERLILALAMLERAVDLYFVEDAEVHDYPPVDAISSRLDFFLHFKALLWCNS